MICPKCNEAAAHRSHRSGVADWAMGLTGRTPYRCRKCNDRFYVYRDGETSPKLRTHEERKVIQLRRRLKWKRLKRVLWSFGVAAAVLFVLLYYLMQQRIGADG